MTLYTVERVHFAYAMGQARVQALRGIDLSIERGSVTALAGPSGSGKSTLLHLLGLLEPVQAGRVTLEGQALSALSERQKNAVRRHKLGFVFQNFHLFPTLTAAENVAFFAARQGLPRSEVTARCEHALHSVGLWEHRDKKPLQMSGGQRQRVAVARALAKRPAVILADEPTASLDQATGGEVMDLLLKLNQQNGVTVLLSSHDPMVLSRVPRQVHLLDGRVVDAVALSTAKSAA